MFYLAVGLIVVGLALILYYALSGSPDEGEVASAPARAQGPRSASEPDRGPDPSTARAVGLPGTGAAGRPVSRPPVSGDYETLYRKLNTDGLAEALQNVRRPGPAGPPPLALKGVLFLKPDRQHFRRTEILENAERAMAAVRRVGDATLFVETGRFLVRAGDASFSYSANDLEEIRFEEGGFAFIPVDRGRPVPVFLTERQDELRDFLKSFAK